MPVFVEDPSQLSKARLKSDLIAHNVALPPATSRKGIYVELHTRHVDQKKCADFSSDEDAETDEETNYAEILDPSSLTDDGLKAALLQHGVKAGPIVASTRALYERKLRNLLFSNGHDKVNDKVDEADEAVLYSDSEEEENSEEEEEKPATEEIQTQTEPADQCQEDDTQELSSQGEDYVYPQCFLVSSRQRVCAAKNSKPCPKRNPRNVLKSSHSAQIPSGISRASSIDQPSGLATGMEGRTSCSSLADASDINQSVVQSHWSRSNRPVVKVPFEDKYNSPDLQFYTPMAGFNEWTRKALYRYFTVYLCISYLYLVWCWLILTKFISHFYMHAL
ncbi:LEM domain-containing protein 1 isoform X2 [Boleophthalmus pectinirostris]|uniref:LEM domain-containing protein 1 isoform X2 n=1 Tax=Boleophthalmus pectinirostris TaxID=150288 RepID=UPI00242AF90D|nr:LEM domain-containing protein 1 isoform X2 [Boleophthalmus pectinirostris]